MSELAFRCRAEPVVCSSLQKLVRAKFRTANLHKARTGCASVFNIRERNRGGRLLRVAEQDSDKLRKIIVVGIVIITTTRELSPDCQRNEKQRIVLLSIQ